MTHWLPFFALCRVYSRNVMNEHCQTVWVAVWVQGAERFLKIGLWKLKSPDLGQNAPRFWSNFLIFHSVSIVSWMWKFVNSELGVNICVNFRFWISTAIDSDVIVISSLDNLPGKILFFDAINSFISLLPFISDQPKIPVPHDCVINPFFVLLFLQVGIF